MGYVLGLDLGTSSLKGLLINNYGEVVYTSSKHYPLIHPQPGFSEQDPKVWVEACQEVLAELTSEVSDFTEQLEGISFSGQMHSLVLLDEDYNVLRNAILWNDVRNSVECADINDNYGKEILHITKNIAREGFTLPKILWVQKHEPEIWAQARHILLPKDYLRFVLTGKLHMDYSDAAGTLLMDIDRKVWSEEVLARYEIKPELLPELIPADGYVGDLTAEIQAEFGFGQVKVFAGGADNACAAVGSGILDEQTAMASIGTSGVFLSYEKSSAADYKGLLHLFNHAANRNSYYSMGVTLAAGHSLDWFKNTFLPDLDFDEALAGAADIQPGANGLLFSPYIVGERTPYSDSKIRGSFIGIDTSHTVNHFARAVLEGITFSLKDSQYLMEEVADKTFKRIVSVGGGAKNQTWLQIQADIFDSEIVTLAADQGPGLGAAMLAAVGLGWYEDMAACTKDFVQYNEAVQPNRENVAVYETTYAAYREVYPATKEISHKLDAIRASRA